MGSPLVAPADQHVVAKGARRGVYWCMAREAHPAARRLTPALPATMGAIALMLVACGGSGFAYVSNTEDQMFFKVPEEWTLFDEEDVITPSQGVSEVQAAELQERVWLRGFDASSDPSAENVLLRSSDQPRGYAEVRLLEAAERDALSLATLRRSGFPVDPETGQPIDPLIYEQENPGGLIRTLSYEDDIVLGSGARGTRVKALIDDEDPSVFEQLTFVDPSTTRRYIFTIGCNLECWTTNIDLIEEVVDSWTVEEPR